MGYSRAISQFQFSPNHIGMKSKTSMFRFEAGNPVIQQPGLIYGYHLVFDQT